MNPSTFPLLPRKLIEPIINEFHPGKDYSNSNENVGQSDPSAERIWPQLTCNDIILAHLFKAGWIDENWLLKLPYEEQIVNVPVIETGKIEVLFNIEIAFPNGTRCKVRDFIGKCYEAATSNGKKIDTFSLLGGYLSVLLTKEPILELFQAILPQINLDNGYVPQVQYNDIDLRIDAHTLPSPHFGSELHNLLPLPIGATKEFFRTIEGLSSPSLDIESIKVDPVDLVYARADIHEQARTEQQLLRVDLLPFLEEEATLFLFGSLQGILDMLLGIGHWVKRENDEWDWCAYVLMVTRGIRFPNSEAEKQLTVTLREKAEGGGKSVGQVARQFKKAQLLSEELKALYLLNCSQILELKNEEAHLFFKDLKTTAALLKVLIEPLASGTLSTEEVKAILNMIAYRALLMSKKDVGQLPFKVELTTHKGELHFDFLIEGGHLLFKVETQKSWKALSEAATESEEKAAAFLSIIRNFGRMSDFSFCESSPIYMEEAVREHFEIPLEDLCPHFTSKQILVERLALFLFAAQHHLKPSVEALIKTIEWIHFDNLEKHHMRQLYEEILLNYPKKLMRGKVYADDRNYLRMGLEGYLYHKKHKLGSLAQQLLFVANSQLHTKGVEWAKTERCMLIEPIEHHLKKGQTARLIPLLILLQDDNTIDLASWKRWLAVVRDYLTSKIRSTVTDQAKLYQVVYEASPFILKIAERYGQRGDLWNETEGMVELFQQLNLPEIAKKLEGYRKIWLDRRDEERFERLLSELKQAPTFENGQRLLTFGPTFTDRVRQTILDLLRRWSKNGLEAASTLVHLDDFKKIFSSKEDKIKLAKLIESDYFKITPTTEQETHAILKLYNLNLPYTFSHFISGLEKIGVTGGEEYRNSVMMILTFYYYQNLLTEDELFEFHYTFLKIEAMREEHALELIQKRYVYSISMLTNASTPERSIKTYKTMVDATAHLPTTPLLIGIISFIRKAINARRLDPNLMNLLTTADYALSMRVLELQTDHLMLHLTLFEDTIVMGGLRFPDRLAKFKQLVFKHIAQDNKRPGQPNEFLLHLFQFFVAGLPTHPSYSPLIDEWISFTEKLNLTPILWKVIGQLQDFYPQNAKGLLPNAYLVPIDTVLTRTPNSEELLKIGLVVTKSNFRNHVHPDDYKRIMKNYFKAVFTNFLITDPDLVDTVKVHWNQLEQHIGQMVYQPAGDPTIQEFELEQTRKDAKQFIYTASESLDCFSIFNTLYTYTLLMVHHKIPDVDQRLLKVNRIINNEMRIQSRYGSMVHFPIYESNFGSMDAETILYIVESLSEIDLTDPTVKSFKNNLMLLLLSKVNFLKDPIFNPHFENIVFSNRDNFSKFHAQLDFKMIGYELIILRNDYLTDPVMNNFFENIVYAEDQRVNGGPSRKGFGVNRPKIRIKRSDRKKKPPFGPVPEKLLPYLILFSENPQRALLYGDPKSFELLENLTKQFEALLDNPHRHLSIESLTIMVKFLGLFLGNKKPIEYLEIYSKVLNKVKHSTDLEASFDLTYITFQNILNWLQQSFTSKWSKTAKLYNEKKYLDKLLAVSNQILALKQPFPYGLQTKLWSALCLKDVVQYIEPKTIKQFEPVINRLIETTAEVLDEGFREISQALDVLDIVRVEGLVGKFYSQFSASSEGTRVLWGHEHLFNHHWQELALKQFSLLHIHQGLINQQLFPITLKFLAAWHFYEDKKTLILDLTIENDATAKSATKSILLQTISQFLPHIDDFLRTAQKPIAIGVKKFLSKIFSIASLNRESDATINDAILQNYICFITILKNCDHDFYLSMRDQFLMEGGNIMILQLFDEQGVDAVL